MARRQFCFYPKGHGSLTFCVIAESEVEARQKVDEHVKAKHYDSIFERPDYLASGWGTDYYYVESYALDQVTEHENN